MGARTRELRSAPDFLALAAARADRFPALLESAAVGGGDARWDILFALPRESLSKSSTDAAEFLPRLDAEWRRERTPRAIDGLPFHGGWFLFLGYELAAEVEPGLVVPMALDAGRVPVALALRCPAALLRDRRRDRVIAVAEDDATLAELLAAVEDGAPAIPTAVVTSPLREDDPVRFLDGVSRVKDYLAAGDVFQVNLSRGWEASGIEAPPAAIYAALRRANPAPFAGLLQQPGWSLASSSPERLVRRRGEVVETRPIAGTMPRRAGEDDGERIRELVGHPKERAEHVMLIDLERNDLGRICVPGTVEVDELMAVESYTHVHHIVSNVRGRPRPGATPGDVVRAVFPGGTITGCPKVRCMEIIGELEGVGRGPYTGTIGYLDRSGDLDLNILIRTLWQVDDTLRLRAGAGIVADSDPVRELEETRAKARGLLRALGAPG